MKEKNREQYNSILSVLKNDLNIDYHNKYIINLLSFFLGSEIERFKNEKILEEQLAYAHSEENAYPLIKEEEEKSATKKKKKNKNKRNKVATDSQPKSMYWRLLVRKKQRILNGKNTCLKA